MFFDIEFASFVRVHHPHAIMDFYWPPSKIGCTSVEVREKHHRRAFAWEGKTARMGDSFFNVNEIRIPLIIRRAAAFLTELANTFETNISLSVQYSSFDREKWSELVTLCIEFRPPVRTCSVLTFAAFPAWEWNLSALIESGFLHWFEGQIV